MFADTFIHFLQTKSFIDEKQAKEALSKRGSKVRPSVVAVYGGLMSEEQVKSVASLQKANDMPFGFLAVREGYLTHEQMANISGRYAKDDLIVLQAFSDKGILPMSKTIEYLKLFKEHYNLDDKSYDALADNKPESYVQLIGGVQGESLFAKFASVFIRTFTRCVDINLRIEEAYTESSIKGKYLTKVMCCGEKEVLVGMAIDDDKTALELASRFMRQRLKEFNEDVEDSAKEFMNIVAGLFATLIERDLYISLELQAPELDVESEIDSDASIEVMNVYAFDCALKIFMIEQ